MVRIRIQPHGQLFDAQGSERLVDVIDDLAGVGLPLACRGGRCGVCRVHVRTGADCFEPAAFREREALRFAYAEPDERMGCQLVLRADADGEVELELSARAGERS